MARNPKHAKPSPASVARTVRRAAGLAVVAGAGLAAAPAAHADVVPQQSPDAGIADAGSAQQSGVSELGGFRLYPLAGTPLDLLSNSVAIPVGGMNVSTLPVTAPFRDGLPLREVPLVGQLLP